MKRSGFLFIVFLLSFFLGQAAAGAAGISDNELKAIFPPGSIILDNKTLNVDGQGYFGVEIMVRVPYKEKISLGDADYDVVFYFRRQILDFNREEHEAIVKQLLAQFANGTAEYWGQPLAFEEVRSVSEPLDGGISTETVDSPQKGEVTGGIVWSQRFEGSFKGRRQVLYNCYYTARVGDFVATLTVSQLPDSKDKAAEWFQRLIAACK